jgi:hypothetical protein
MKHKNHNLHTSHSSLLPALGGKDAAVSTALAGVFSMKKLRCIKTARMLFLCTFSLFPFLCSLFIISCGDTDSGTGNYQRFDWDLHGTWTTNDPGSLYTGTLVIEYNRITITGYGETQTPPFSDDNKRPFRNYIKGIALKGYSEDGKLFIEDGTQQEGIPYTYWYINPPPNFNRVEFLRFNFGGREETLYKQW